MAFLTDIAVWEAAVPIQNSLENAENEAVRKSILVKLHMDAEAEDADVQ